MDGSSKTTTIIAEPMSESDYDSEEELEPCERCELPVYLTSEEIFMWCDGDDCLVNIHLDCMNLVEREIFDSKGVYLCRFCILHNFHDIHLCCELTEFKNHECEEFLLKEKEGECTAKCCVVTRLE